jgi:hypothetical protein
MAIIGAALVSAVLPVAYAFVPFNTGPLRCGAPWDDAFIDVQATVAGAQLSDPRDRPILREVLDTCRGEGRQRVGAVVSVSLMILVVDAICLVQAGRHANAAQPLPQHELLHLA